MSSVESGTNFGTKFRWPLDRSSPSQHEVIPPADWVCGPDELSGW